MEHLGDLITAGSISMDKSKVEGVLTWPILQLVKDLRGFLGLFGYYRRFIKGYGIIAAPFTALLQKEVPWEWIELAQSAFMTLKEAICSAPVLALPNFTEQFCVETDPCGQGFRAVLQQKGQSVAYFSKALGVNHQALSIYDKEIMAIIMEFKNGIPIWLVIIF